jgi:hypothetical protein
MFTGTLEVSGVTEIDAREDEATTKFAVALTDPICAVIVVDPADCPVANPNAVMVAAFESEELHCARWLRLKVVLSL